MKHQLYRLALSGLLATGLTLGSAAAFAQRQQHRTPQERVAHMAKRYDLTSDQQAQIMPILVNQRQQMKALRHDTTLSAEDKMARMQSIHADSTNKIQALLNDSQKQKFAQDQERRQQRMQQHSGAAAPTA